MIVVICADHALAREVVAAAGAGEAVEAAHNWQHVSAHTRVRASVCVYGTARLDDRARAQLEEIRQSRPNMPLVLVTQHSRENSRALKDVSPSDVVWLDRVAEDLPSTLADLSRTVSVAGQLALLLESDGRIAGTKLLRTLLEILRRGGRVPSLRSLARSTNRTEKAVAGDFRTLFDLDRVCVQWKRTARTAIIHDCDAAGKLTAKEAARVLGIDIRTLYSSIRRTTGVTYGRLQRLAPDDVLRRLAASLGLSVAMPGDDSRDTTA